MWLSRVRTLHSVLENAGLIPGLAQWVKDLAGLQASEEVAAVAWIWCGRGRGRGWQLQL